MSDIDVSVILNMHREALFLAPTLHSLQACAQEAKNAGLIVELVAVFDRSDDATREVFRSIPMPAFCRVREVDVDVGSLGLARNAGIEHAQGEYIWTSDADDLVSSNCIVALLETAQRHPNPKVVVFIEYLCAFGEKYFNCRYVGSEYLAAADFVFQHPYVSRIFVRREAFEAIRYEDLRVTSGFAYEDWFLNCELHAMGYDMAVAQGTVFFYRQRTGSLLRQADAASARLVPHSRLFDVARFLEEMDACRRRAGSWKHFLARREKAFHADNTASFMQSEKLGGYLRDAARLEPELEPSRVASAGSYSPLPWNPLHWGMQLETLYRLVGGGAFDEIVLLPWLRPGGAEKYILHVVEELQRQRPGTRVLVVAGEPAGKHEWIKRLPPSAVFLDICNAFPSLDQADRDAMLVRALLATGATTSRLHVKASGFSHRFLDAYATVLRDRFNIVYYRFCDDVLQWQGRSWRGPWGVAVMRRHLPGFWKVISDCRAMVRDDLEVLGTLQGKYETLYTRCDAGAVVRHGPQPKRRLLWASRIGPQKRPDLLVAIANAMVDAGLDVEIDVYGMPDAGVDLGALFDGGSRVRYRGGFSGFHELPISSYDGFLYTSGYDGLPNILLEALAAGLPVIAPDVGGIGEVVRTGVTGWLVRGEDEQDLVAAYVRAIRAMYAGWDSIPAMAEAGRALIEREHGASAFSGRVARVFELGAPPSGGGA